ncbi:MAG: DnaA regulatory inactivator Hda [Gammaproteobacteria bacterium]
MVNEPLSAYPQLALNLGLKDNATFANFHPGANGAALDHLRKLGAGDTDTSTSVYLWGAPGAGKSHLLQALCNAAGARGAAALYLPLAEARQFPVEALQGLENVALVCIDDVQAIAGQEEWELGLVHLFERIREAGGVLAAAGRALPANLNLQPQLASRLNWGLVFQLRELIAADQQHALRLRAEQRGLRLPLDAGRFLVRHYGGDSHRLFAALDRLDQASLAAQRKLTVPFIRAVLGTASSAELGGDQGEPPS